MNDQKVNSIGGCQIDWTINGGGGYFFISNASGYTAVLNSSSNTPGGASCTVTTTIQGTDIGADSPEVVVFEPEILEPNEDPVTDNNFTFDTSNPGKCNVTGSGTSHVSSLENNLTWSVGSADSQDWANPGHQSNKWKGGNEDGKKR